MSNYEIMQADPIKMQIRECNNYNLLLQTKWVEINVMKSDLMLIYTKGF